MKTTPSNIKVAGEWLQCKHTLCVVHQLDIYMANL